MGQKGQPPNQWSRQVWQERKQNKIILLFFGVRRVDCPFLPRSRIGASSTLESSMKRFLRKFDLNQNKAKQSEINDVFYCFTSKAYSPAIF